MSEADVAEVSNGARLGELADTASRCPAATP